MNSSLAARKVVSAAFPLRSFRKTMKSFTADCSAGESCDTSCAKSSGFMRPPNTQSIHQSQSLSNEDEKLRVVKFFV